MQLEISDSFLSLIVTILFLHAPSRNIYWLVCNCQLLALHTKSVTNVERTFNYPVKQMIAMTFSDIIVAWQLKDANTGNGQLSIISTVSRPLIIVHGIILT
jgi:hypothetical protein